MVAGRRVRLLLDTHVLLDLFTAPREFSAAVLATIRDPETHVAVSAASVWEIEIKRKQGRLTAPPDVMRRIRIAGFSQLAISSQHAVAAARLPLHHRDPFDRMLVAQAQLEGLTIVTSDREIPKYQVAVLPA